MFLGKYGLFFLNIKLFSSLYMYVILSVLMNVIIILLISRLCMHETHVKYVMTVFLIKSVLSLVVTFYVGIGDV
jgi:hypothetical protein